jgi:hypothetical protein
MELNKEKKMKSEQAVLPNPCLEEEEEEEELLAFYTSGPCSSSGTRQRSSLGTKCFSALTSS